MIKILQKTVTFLSLVICITAASAQDAHFTQYFATPLQVNPAMTGVFDGKFRASNTYRSQWSGLGKGYKTLHLSADLPVGKGEIGNGFFGVGFMMYQDKAGTAGYSNNIFEGSLSYVTALDPTKDHFLSIGFQAGLNQSSIDLSKATWDSQWNGDQYDAALPSREAIQLQQFSYLDFNAGVMYYYVPNEANSFSVGGAMQHIGAPNVSFYSEGNNPLNRRYTFHSSAEISLTKENAAWVTPRLLYMRQGNQQMILTGAYFKSKIQFKSRYTNYKKEAYVLLGGFYRYKDALAVAARFEYNMFGLGISYDINTSYLSNLTSANAIEINLTYVTYIKRGERQKHYSKTPRFF